MGILSLVVPKKGTRTHTNVTVDTSADLIVAANGNRKSVVIQNNGAVTVYLGKSNVAASSTNQGYALAAGQTFVDNASTEAWHGITASSSATLHVIEVA